MQFLCLSFNNVCRSTRLYIIAELWHLHVRYCWFKQAADVYSLYMYVLEYWSTVYEFLQYNSIFIALIEESLI